MRGVGEDPVIGGVRGIGPTGSDVLLHVRTVGRAKRVSVTVNVLVPEVRAASSIV